MSDRTAKAPLQTRAITRSTGSSTRPTSTDVMITDAPRIRRLASWISPLPITRSRRRPITDYRRVWSGVVMCAPARSDAGLATAMAVAAIP